MGEVGEPESGSMGGLAGVKASWSVLEWTVERYDVAWSNVFVDSVTSTGTPALLRSTEIGKGNGVDGGGV